MYFCCSTSQYTDLTRKISCTRDGHKVDFCGSIHSPAYINWEVGSWTEPFCTGLWPVLSAPSEKPRTIHHSLFDLNGWGGQERMTSKLPHVAQVFKEAAQESPFKRLTSRSRPHCLERRTAELQLSYFLSKQRSSMKQLPTPPPPAALATFVRGKKRGFQALLLALHEPPWTALNVEVHGWAAVCKPWRAQNVSRRFVSWVMPVPKLYPADSRQVNRMAKQHITLTF